MTKIILDLYGGTGAWSEPYRLAGYTVHNITLPAYDVTATEAGLVLVFKGGSAPTLTIPASAVYGILAAPPCTEFSLAKRLPPTGPDYANALANVSAALRIIWQCAMVWPKTLKFWALENPWARLRWFLGEPPFVFNQSDFGDNHDKKTCIWGYFNAPRKPKTMALFPAEPLAKDETLPPLPPGYICPPGWSRRAARRSMTPPGFAKAFFMANR